MIRYRFKSALAFRLQTFWETRMALGRKGAADLKLLSYLDRFLSRMLKPGQTITREVTEQWMKSMQCLSVGTRINRISILRQFCRYLNQFDSRTYLINRVGVPRRIRPAPYIFTSAEIGRVIQTIKHHKAKSPLRLLMLSTLIGLLYSTGLRVGEALRLTLADVDLRRRLLIIRQTKFKKSRYVPISPSTARALTLFLEKRRAYGCSTSLAAPLFQSPTGIAYGHPGMCEYFLMILRKIGIRGPTGEKGPRIHDLRHSFAVERLAKWYRQGVSLPEKLPLLTTYLGHTTPFGTQVYLHATAELLKETSRRFYNCSTVFNQKKESNHEC
ncbi:MAG: tyrosine-type recombinase/integrase [Candidatus Omnitrophota bacterium]